MIGNPLKGLSSLGHCYAAAGYTDKATEVLKKLKRREELEPGVTLHLDYAVVYAGLKDHDKAFYYLNKAYEERMGIACLGMIFCVRFPAMKELKADPRFQQLITKMELKT